MLKFGKMEKWFMKFDIMTYKEFLGLHIIKFVSFFTSRLSNKDAMLGTRLKFVSRMDNNSIENHDQVTIYICITSQKGM